MGRHEEGQVSEFVERLVHINRVAKVVKGGRRFGFAALVVVGDQKGRAGYGRGKAREVPEAIRKATETAKRAMVRVPLREGRTLHHDVEGRSGAGKAFLRAAPAGTGIIAGGPMRAVFDALGVQDVVAKSLGSSNPNNMVRAVFDGLAKQASPRIIAQRRGKKVSDILRQRVLPQDRVSSDEENVKEKQEKKKAKPPKHIKDKKAASKKEASQESESKTKKKPAVKKSSAKPAAKAATKSETKSATKSSTKSTTKPATKSAAKPAAKSPAKPAAKKDQKDKK